MVLKTMLTTYDISLLLFLCYAMSLLYDYNINRPEYIEGGGGVVRYHTEGSMKLNARILLLTHMVYL